MNNKINWGILGLGNIATKFASDLQLSTTSTLQGVASRSLDKAKAFGDQFNATKHYGTYDDLANDPDIDIIYIATPHPYHFENTMMCLKKGKAVLCEKPMGMDSEQVKLMLEEAKAQNVFLMEAIWTRFMPAIEKVLELLDQNVIGDVQFIRADFGFKAPVNFDSRLYNKALGGGSLLDIGLYPIYFSLLTLGIPTDVKAMARMTKTEVDSYCAMLFDYKDGKKASLESTIEGNTPTEAVIYGSKGSIKLHHQFHHCEKITVSIDGIDTVYDLKHEGFGYFHEIEHVNQCLFNTEIESSKVPHNTSTNLMALIDIVKAKIGLTYPI